MAIVDVKDREQRTADLAIHGWVPFMDVPVAPSIAGMWNESIRLGFYVKWVAMDPSNKTPYTYGQACWGHEVYRTTTCNPQAFIDWAELPAAVLYQIEQRLAQV